MLDTLLAISLFSLPSSLIVTEELGFLVWHISRCTFEDLATEKIFNDYLGFDFTMLSKGLFFCR